MFAFKDKKLANEIISDIKKRQLNLKFMHVCGTHQDTLVKHGLNVLFKKCGIEIGQGPGCPVCVTTPEEIEEIMLLAQNGKTIATFGDMINVPSENRSLQIMRTEGCNVKTVYGIEDALIYAKKNRKSDVVFMAVGFETTAPTTASVLLKDLPENFSILCCHRIIPPALKTILEMGEIKLDGLIEPGHVSTIIGTKPYEFISKNYNIPQVVAGFEPLDLLMATWMLVNQIEKDEPYVQNEYFRVVSEYGNVKAQKMIKNVFILKHKKWRGFPVIENSSLEIKNNLNEFNARKKYEDELEEIYNKDFQEPQGCKCGELLRGLMHAKDCPLFGKQCKPNNPVGPCMVSIEGSCNIEYRYSKKY